MKNGRKITVSIIIVHYQATKEISDCLRSLKDAKISLVYEIIVVDNNTNDNEKEFKKVLSNIIYIKTHKNIGFGAANNRGVEQAKGEYLFFLNPDTFVFKGAIDELIAFYEKKEKIGIVAPLLLDSNNKPYALQGTQALTPLRGIFGLSFINKFIPRNKISKEYWQIGWDKTKEKEVAVVPGTAFVIKKEIFEKVGGFDEKIFLFFEEADICKRVQELGLSCYIIPKAKVYHAWGVSTKKEKNIDSIFSKSRFFYFRKHYGLLSAIIVWYITSLNKETFFLLLTFAFGLWMRFYKLSELMNFIGDQGWFYLSARDIFLTHTIPLVGIPSSVTWLHQGPLTTYIIALCLFIGRFNPVAPGYFFAFADTLTIFFVYLLGKNIFNKTTGLLASVAYVSSPVVLINARMPYHTSLIPLFTSIFFLLLIKIVNGKRRLIFLAFLFLGLLLQLELSNAIVGFILFISWFLYKPRFSKKEIYLGIFGFLLGVLPFLLYDVTHGFVQTIGFPLWIANRIRLFLGLSGPSGHATTPHVTQAFKIIWMQLNGFVFPASVIVFLLVTVSTAGVFFSAVRFSSQRAEKKLTHLLLLWTFVPLLGYMVHTTPGTAYFPFLYPVFSLILGFSFYQLLLRNRLFIVFVIFFFLFNSYFTIKNDYFLTTRKGTHPLPPTLYSFGSSIDLLKEATNVIVSDANGNPFVLKGGGYLSKQGVENYMYLAWWQGGKINPQAKTVYVMYQNKKEVPQQRKPFFSNESVSIIKIL